MKKFSLKFLIFLIISSLTFIVFLNQYKSYIDYYYIKFTSSKQHSFIIGDSRSFMGIRPDIIDKEIKNFEHPMFNYSFTITNSSYGDCYLNSIKRKLDPNTKNGLFILSINPFVLAERENDTIQKGIYHEANLPPHNIYFQSINPNLEYVFKNFKNFHFKGFYRKNSKVHNDGWQEVMNLPTDSITSMNLVKNNIKTFTNLSRRWKKSKYRLDKLEETIVYLKNYGRVVLVRMPSHTKLNNIEDEFWNNFDGDINKLAQNTEIKYFNFKSSSNQYRLFDGVHLDLPSTKIFTKTLCDSINLE